MSNLEQEASQLFFPTRCSQCDRVFCTEQLNVKVYTVKKLPSRTGQVSLLICAVPLLFMQLK